MDDSKVEYCEDCEKRIADGKCTGRLLTNYVVRDGLPAYCWACEVRDMCNGGCPKNRFLRTPEGEAGLNYLCAGYKRFFTACRPFIAALAALRPHAKTGRNDPCPCGSGKKYKACCLGR